ncbi:TPA: hypothetical protein ACKPZ9_000725 [Stenotrophomonas maltophilia]
MDNPQNSADAYSIILARRLDTEYASWSTVEILIYDDDRDLVLLVRATDESEIQNVVSAFDTETKMNALDLTSKASDDYVPIYFSENPRRGDLLLAAEAAIKSFELRGYNVTHRVNNWN